MSHARKMSTRGQNVTKEKKWRYGNKMAQFMAKRDVKYVGTKYVTRGEMSHVGLAF
jgi:hypothetical protein